MKRKSKVRLYNVIFPVWILMFWPSPPVVLITFFGNLAIDCLVVFFALLALKHLAKGHTMLITNLFDVSVSYCKTFSSL